MGRRKKLSSNIESLLTEMQDIYSDINEQKNRILLDYEHTKTEFEEKMDNIEQENAYSKIQNDRLKLYNDTLQKHLELLKVHTTIVNKPTTQTPQPTEDEEQKKEVIDRPLTSEDFAKIREAIKKTDSE